jgi:hypothetical protein
VNNQQTNSGWKVIYEQELQGIVIRVQRSETDGRMTFHIGRRPATGTHLIQYVPVMFKPLRAVKEGGPPETNVDYVKVIGSLIEEAVMFALAEEAQFREQRGRLTAPLMEWLNDRDKALNQSLQLPQSDKGK